MTLKNLRSAALLALVSLSPLFVPTTAAAFGAPACDAAPPPVMTLAYGSRYATDSANRSQIDKQSNAEVNAALKPVDDFLRDLTSLANEVANPGADAAAISECALSQIATWADANALANLESRTARLTIGSRLAGFGFVLLQTVPHARNSSQMQRIAPWLEGLMLDQMVFWEEEAPDGARRGNLRAWAALAGATIGTVIDDPVVRGWSAWSSSYVICTANPDGSLPQEMTRGKYALHYQLHAIAPLTVSSALLSRRGIDLTARCDHALARIVDFAVNDLKDGMATQAITGQRQSLFDGTDTLESFQLAWLEAYLSIHYDPALIGLADAYRPLNYSKLGGDQAALWQQMQW